jgi:hypothetical protein
MNLKIYPLYRQTTTSKPSLPRHTLFERAYVAAVLRDRGILPRVHPSWGGGGKLVVVYCGGRGCGLSGLFLGDRFFFLGAVRRIKIKLFLADRNGIF